MKPDLEWHVDDPEGEQTVAQTSPPRRTQWRGWAIGLMVLLGIGLGLVYQSIPEPLPPIPTPTRLPPPTPQALPLALYQTIEREVRALEFGNSHPLSDLLDAENAAFQPYRTQSGQWPAWGIPRDATLYTIHDFGLLAGGHAWVDISQYRRGRSFRETRFYRQVDEQWKRTNPDAAFWSGQTETSETPHFRFIYGIEDRNLMRPIVTLLEQDYAQICADFDCPVLARQCVTALDQVWCSPYAREMTFVWDLRATDGPSFDQVDSDPPGIIITYVSPRVGGDAEGPVDYLRNVSAWLHVMKLAYRSVNLPGTGRGRAVAIVLFYREYNRLLARTGEPPLFQPVDIPTVDTTQLPLLETAWQEPDQTNYDQAYALIYSLVDFIDQDFGPPATAKLLKSIGSSQSLAEAIETSTGLSYVEFEGRWQAWITSNALPAP